MRTLEQSLYDHELIVLRVLGEWWELDLAGADKAACVKALATMLTTLDMQTEFHYLPPEEQDALQALLNANGRLPVAVFSRTYGEVRQMGPGKLEREEPWFDPANVAEALWYRGFLFRGFDDSVNGMGEFYYLPRELTAQLLPETQTPTQPAVAPHTAAPPPPPATPVTPVTAVTAEPATETTFDPRPAPSTFTPANTSAVDDLTTILALAQQRDLQTTDLNTIAPYLTTNPPQRDTLLVTLAVEMAFLRQSTDGFKPTRTALTWLGKDRESQLHDLIEAWSRSEWNALRHTPHLLCEGNSWHNDPITPRTALIDVMPATTEWYLVGDIVETIKQALPDFQRPNGDYDSWYIRDALQNSYLRGFDSWDQVEGRLLFFILTDVLPWLGMVETDKEVYRLTARALAWLHNTEPPSAEQDSVQFAVQADASLIVPAEVSRLQRFQIARIADPQPYTAAEPYRYQITPQSLLRAQGQGIEPARILQFLTDGNGASLPISAKRAIERWATNGTEARISAEVILRVADPDILDKLRSNPKTQPFLGESLGDLAVVIRPGQWEAFCHTTAKLGLLTDTTNLGDREPHNL